MHEDIRSIDELTLDNQRVFIRADFDVPLSGGRVTNDRRLRAILPTLKKVQSAGARLILGARLAPSGPRGKTPTSLEAVGVRLSELLETEIYLPDESVGDAARKVVQDLRPGQICLLENLAFHAEEAENDEVFARKLGALCDVYVNDAPRALAERTASTHQLARVTREKGIGYLVAAELSALSRLRSGTEKPFVAVLGGARVRPHLDLIEALLGRANTICVGGALGSTLLRASGAELGASPVDQDSVARARALLARARERGSNVVLPLDLVISDASGGSTFGTVSVRDVPKNARAVDVGPRTLEAFARALASAKTALFAGALNSGGSGAGQSTRDLAGALVPGATYSVLAEDPDASVEDEQWTSQFSFVSAGGNASLEYLVGRKLPGLEVLRGGAT